MEPTILVLILLCSCSMCIKGGVLRRTQCSQAPGYCPQYCLVTVGGCMQCTCIQNGGLFGQHPVLSGSFSGSPGTSNSGVSMTNPNGMLAFGSQSSAGALLGPVVQGGGALHIGSLTSGLGGNAGNVLIQHGSQVSSVDPSNPLNVGNPSSVGSKPSGGNPANPVVSLNGGQNPGNPVGPSSVVTSQGANTSGGPVTQTGNNNGGTGSHTGNTISGAGTQTGNGNQQTAAPVTTRLTTSIKLTTKPSTTTTVATTKTATTTTTTTISTSTTKTTTTVKPPPAVTTVNRPTCAPLRCVAPCDKGIALAPNGCPVCLCA